MHYLNTHTLVKHLLVTALSHHWTLQGFGMLRLYLPDNLRLNVWDSRFRTPGVSMVHDHLQWGLKSTIIAGRLQNIRYAEVAESPSVPYHGMVIRPGHGVLKRDDLPLTYLREMPAEVYHPGATYRQAPSEIHRTAAEDGTVTLLRKKPTFNNSARIYWPHGSEWVSAEPRAASPDEVQIITSHALQTWFPEAR